MNATTEYLHSEIYPALFQVLPSALPEFDFVRIADGYKSTNALKNTGEQGNSRGKVYVYENSPGYLKDWRGEPLSLWNYVAQRDTLTSNQDVFKRLAELAGVPLTEQQFTPEQSERFAQSRCMADAWEAANNYFIECLSHKGSTIANSSMAARIRDYLEAPKSEGGRGYGRGLFRLFGQGQDRESPKMEMGYMPGLPELSARLASLGIADREREEIIRRVGKGGANVGTQNVLSFPYRDHTGRIRGMGFRVIVSGIEPKYLYSEFDKGDRAGILFNLKAVSKDKDLTIVEAPLDSLHAAALGIRNIVALGGSGGGLNKTQVDLAIRYGAEQITLMFDNDSEDGIDRAGAKGTDAAIAFLQQAYPQLKVFVGQYPAGIKDLDELLAAEGEEGYHRVKGTAIASWEYQLNRLFVKYSQIADEYLTAKQVSTLLEEVVNTSVNLSATDKDLFITAFTSDQWVKESGITKESINETVDEIRAAKAKERKNQSTKDLLGEVKKTVDKGNTDEALKQLKKGVQEISSRDKTDTFTGLLKPETQAEFGKRLAKMPIDLKSGFIIEGEELLIPIGAITIVAAPTSHGKTRFLLNLAINLTREMPLKNVYVLSFEESADAVLLSALSIYGGLELSKRNPATIQANYRDKNWQYVTGDKRVNIEPFEKKRDEFFADFIEPGKLSIKYIDYDSDSLTEAIRFLHKKGNAGAVIVDYIQLLHKGKQGDNKYATRQEELKQICLDLKDVAVDTGMPIILGAQFNRMVRSPMALLSENIREAADIEQIANLVLGMWNHKFKMTITEEDREALNTETNYRGGDDRLYIKKMKHRTGESGLNQMFHFDQRTGSIGELDKAVYVKPDKPVNNSFISRA